MRLFGLFNDRYCSPDAELSLARVCSWVSRIAPSTETHHRARLTGHVHGRHVLPANAARHFLMLRDGAVTAGYLDSTTAAQRTFKRGVEGLLRSIDMEPSPDDDS
jgi:hypothetical protein